MLHINVNTLSDDSVRAVTQVKHIYFHTAEGSVCVRMCVRAFVCVLSALDSLLMRVIKGFEWPRISSTGWTETGNIGVELISYMTWPWLDSAPPKAIGVTAVKHQQGRNRKTRESKAAGFIFENHSISSLIFILFFLFL